MPALIQKLLIALFVFTLTACGSNGGGGGGSSTPAAPSDDVELSVGTLDQPFDPDVPSYTGSVANDVSSFSMTPSLIEEGATVTINGQPVTPGQPSPDIPLSVGDNVITMVVTEADGVTERNYTFTITRNPAAVDLTALTLSEGTLSPAFAVETTSYTAAVVGSVSSIDVTPTLADSTSTVTVGGVDAISGIASVVNLSLGANVIDIVVTAADSTTKTYTVTVTRLENNAALSALSLSDGSLSPAFDAATTSYSATVPYVTTSIDVTATVVDAGASITVAGAAATTGVAKSVNLNVGVNSIDIVVTAPDSTTNTYTISVTRSALSSDNSLSALALSDGTLSPAFASGITVYTASVPYATNSIDVTATVNYVAATVTIGGSAATSSVASTVPLSVGANAIDIVVTAEDSTQQTYTVTITRAAASTNANLSGLTINPGSLVEPFNVDTLSYTATVAYTATSIDVTATLADSLASMTVDGVATNSGQAKAVALSVGANAFSVVVTAESGATKTYNLTITRSAASTDATLSTLTLSSGALVPGFDPGILAYDVSVSNATTSITMTATANDSNYTSLTIDGASEASGVASNAINLAIGDNSVPIVVTAEDGITTETYTITVHRISNVDTLSDLQVSTSALDQIFDSASLAYTMTVPYLTSSMQVTPSLTDSNATMTVEGVSVADGATSDPIALAVGVDATVVNIIVTAEDGISTKEYTITVTREDAAAFAQEAYVKASNTETLDSFGASVAISGDTMVIGAPQEDSGATGIDGNQIDDCGGAATNCASNSGAVYVFTRSGTTWTQQAYIKAPDTDADDKFGYAVDIDGDTLVVSAPFEDSSAASVTNSADFGTAPWSDASAGQSGAVYVYTRSAGVWSLNAFMKASNVEAGDNFGLSVAVDGDRLAVGAPYEDSADAATPTDNSLQSAGAVYTYDRTGTTWAFGEYLKASNVGGANLGDQFGLSIALDADTLVVGAPFEDSSSEGIYTTQVDIDAATDDTDGDTGAVYVFTHSGTNWGLGTFIKATNTAPGGNGLDEFGIDVDILGDTMAIGAGRESAGDAATPGTNPVFGSGAVYILTRSGGVWSHQAFLKASTVESNDRFGKQVALGNGYLVVGAPGEASNATTINGSEADNSVAKAGALYMFTGSGASWTQTAYIKVTNTSAGDELGGDWVNNSTASQRLATDAGTVVAGTILEDGSASGINQTSDDAEADAGAAYVFK